MMRRATRGPTEGSEASRAVAIVPARLASSRLPRKMLLRETGRYLFEETARNAARAARIERVLVAADSDEVLAAAREVGIEAVRTDPNLASGTDRVHAAFAALSAAEREGIDVVVNVQGDEPDLEPADLDALVAAFADPAVELATLAAPLESEEAWRSSHVVKVLVDARGDALVFTRAPLPDRSRAPRGCDPLALARRHIGVYAFRPAALARFTALPRGAWERAESLEQLRWLEAGHSIRVVPATRAPRGIDTEEDYARHVERVLGNPSSTSADGTAPSGGLARGHGGAFAHLVSPPPESNSPHLSSPAPQRCPSTSS